MGTGCCSSKSTSTRKSLQPDKPQSDPLFILLSKVFSSKEADWSPVAAHIESVPEDAKRCLKFMRTKVRTAVSNPEHTHEELLAVTTVLRGVDVLHSLSPLQFAAFLYEVAGELVEIQSFVQVREQLYRSLEIVTEVEILELSLVTEKFLSGLLSFCEKNPELVTASEISQIHKLIRSSDQISPLRPDPVHAKWEKLIDYLLQRLLSDVPKQDSAPLIDAETQLLATLSKLFATSEKSTLALFTKTLEFVEENQAWGKVADASFCVVLTTLETCREKYSSLLLKLMLNSLTRMQDKAHIAVMCGYIEKFLKLAANEIATITYTAVSGIQDLLREVVRLLDDAELKHFGGKLVTAWCQKTDIQSCIRFLAELAKDQKPLNEDCFRHLKKAIRSRIIADWEKAAHNDYWNQLLSSIMQSCSKSQSHLTYELVEFLVTLLGRSMKTRLGDVNQYSKAAISFLSSSAHSMTADWLRLCKHCVYTWLSFSATENPVIVPTLLSVSSKLQVMRMQRLGELAPTPAVQVSLNVLMLVVVHSVGTYYDMQSLLAFVYACSKEIKKIRIYEELFVYARWDTVRESANYLFRKSHLPLFLSITESPSLSQVPLRMSMEDLSISRGGADLSSLRESLDPLETIQSDYSDLSPGRSEDILIEMGEDEEGEVGRTRNGSWWARRSKDSR